MILRASRVALFSLCLLCIGLAGAYASVGPEVISGDRVEFRSATGDTAIGMAGFRYFVDDEWRFPLLKTDSLDAPDGTIIAFTDSIPLLALVAKSLGGLGFEISVEQWWGWWFALVFVGQAAGGAYVVREWSSSRYLIPLAATPLFVMFPPFLLKVFHPALAFQAPLLISLGLVASIGRKTTASKMT